MVAHGGAQERPAQGAAFRVEKIPIEAQAGRAPIARALQAPADHAPRAAALGPGRDEGVALFGVRGQVQAPAEHVEVGLHELAREARPLERRVHRPPHLARDAHQLLRDRRRLDASRVAPDDHRAPAAERGDVMEIAGRGGHDHEGAGTPSLHAARQRPRHALRLPRGASRLLERLADGHGPALAVGARHARVRLLRPLGLAPQAAVSPQAGAG